MTKPGKKTIFKPLVRRNSLKSRHRSEMRFKYIGLGAIGISFIFLVFLIGSILWNGMGGFTQARIKLPITFDKEDVQSENYGKLIRNSFDAAFPAVTDHDEKSQLYHLTSSDAKYILANLAKDNAQIIGTTEQVWLPAEQNVEIYVKHSSADWKLKITPKQQEFVNQLQDQNRVATKFNGSFFTASDSQNPESAGIAGALIGTILLLFACMIIALPIGVLTAIYLEEFAPKNRITDILEININNLAAVPSIVFGLLGLAVYLNFFGLPRSAPIVGGMTLALMVIPVIIIATRASLKAIPPSIRQGAMALGASPMQVVKHHCLPLAMPGIMTGTILGIARAMGETAPLLMIGMVAFISDIPHGLADPATAMPVQIFLWAKNSQPGFVQKTAAAIIVLLAILIFMNIIAVWIRKKYERRW